MPVKCSLGEKRSGDVSNAAPNTSERQVKVTALPPFDSRLS
jgi:hypothetical protein